MSVNQSIVYRFIDIGRLLHMKLLQLIITPVLVAVP